MWDEVEMCWLLNIFECHWYFIFKNCSILNFILKLFSFKHILRKIVVSIIQIWRRQCHPIPVLLPGKSRGWRNLTGCSPWGRYESDVTERLHFHVSLPCIGEGNGNPLQCSCLENPTDGGAWWAAIYGVAQSRTRLKRLSSSNSIIQINFLYLSVFSFLKIKFR